MELVLLTLCCARFWSCLIGMITLRRGSEAAILTLPKNTMALANASVEFQCSTDSNKSLQWSVTYSGTTKSITLFARGNFTSAGESMFRIKKSIDGQHNLIIDSANFSYAGKYKCSEGSFGTEVEAELAVIDSQPSCQVNSSSTDNSVLENDYLWMQCNLNFSGNVNLRTSWIRNSTGDVLHNSLSDRSYSMIVIQISSSDNGETFTFKAIFTQENNSRETVITWNYTVKVLYSTWTTQDSPGLPGILVFVVAVAIICVTPVIAYVSFRVYRKMESKRQEALAEGEHQSQLNRELEEETRIANEHSQQQETTNQSLGIEENYADLTDRSFNDQQYSRLHIYANASASTNVSASASAEYANLKFREVMKKSKDYYNIASN